MTDADAFPHVSGLPVFCPCCPLEFRVMLWTCDGRDWRCKRCDCEWDSRDEKRERKCPRPLGAQRVDAKVKIEDEDLPPCRRTSNSPPCPWEPNSPADLMAWHAEVARNDPYGDDD